MNDDVQKIRTWFDKHREHGGDHFVDRKTWNQPLWTLSNPTPNWKRYGPRLFFGLTPDNLCGLRVT